VLVIHVGTPRHNIVLQNHLTYNSQALPRPGPLSSSVERRPVQARLMAMAAQAFCNGKSDVTSGTDSLTKFRDSESRTNRIVQRGFWFGDPAAVRPHLQGRETFQIVVSFAGTDRIASLYHTFSTRRPQHDFHTWREKPLTGELPGCGRTMGAQFRCRSLTPAIRPQPIGDTVGGHLRGHRRFATSLRSKALRAQSHPSVIDCCIFFCSQSLPFKFIAQLSNA